MSHIPVMLSEVIEALSPKTGGVYVDATFGRGGHTRAILEKIGPNGTLIAFDQDETAIAQAKALAQEDPRVIVIHDSFANMGEHLDELGYNGQIDGILMDLGVCSAQIDKPERGFSFMADGPLDMRMNQTKGPSAATWLKHATVNEMTKVFKELGEERFAYRIANKVVDSRVESPLETTSELVSLIREAIPFEDKHKHPATRTFQSIRMHVNGELEALEDVLDQAFIALKKGGKLCAISFHSLEDRMVKRFMRDKAHIKLPKGLPVLEADINRQLKIAHKVMGPGTHELNTNPRSRSAKLRTAIKL